MNKPWVDPLAPSDGVLPKQLSINAERVHDRSVLLTGAQWKKVDAVLEAAYIDVKDSCVSDELRGAIETLFPTRP